MGAMTYIGNAPNLMMYHIAKQYHVAMPSFLGYFALTALGLLPILWIMSLIWL